jgi:uroporphyrinogen decarboxylase
MLERSMREVVAQPSVPLHRADVKASIHFAFPARIPIASLLPCTGALEQRHGERLQHLRSQHPDDVLSTNITIDYWTAPPDDPGYRFALDGAEKPSAAAMDAASVIPDWSFLDRFLAEFPTAWREEPMEKVRCLRRDNPDRYLLVSFGHYFAQRLASLRGAEAFLLDLHEHPDELRRVMDRLLELYSAWARRVRSAGADGVHGGDDLGTQRGLFMSPATFRGLLLPYYAALGDVLHREGLDFWLHTCGDVTEILPDLVRAGVDVLHPVQPGCMDAERVVQGFGGSLAFHVGMDVQSLIPRGPPERIRSGVAARAQTFYRRDGGMILGAGNVLTEDIPWGHIKAYAEAVSGFIASRAGGLNG